MEVSSFQLERMTDFAPLAAAVLNISPDHLNRYSGFEQYRDTKLRLLRHIQRCCLTVLRQDLLVDKTVRDCLPSDGTQPVLFALRETPEASFFLAADGTLMWRSPHGKRPLLHESELKLSGLHNVENVLAAAGLLGAAGLCPVDLIRHASRFVPAPHRLDLVAVHNNIRFVNDSKATNVDALLRGLQATAETTQGGILLIAGGLDKDLDFAPLRPWLGRLVKEVFLIGSCRERLAKTWKDVVSCKTFASLDAAVAAAVDNALPGDTVLLSPGCASQDMYESYEQRGHDFSLHVKRRLGEGSLI